MKNQSWILLLFPLVFWACGGTVIPTDPVKEMKKKFVSKNAYTIILSDMDLVDEQYRHKYKILELTKEGKVIVSSTEWENVTDDFFALHESNLGMEVLSKKENGKYNNLITPPGFTNLIGDMRFGYWTETFSTVDFDAFGSSVDVPVSTETDSTAQLSDPGHWEFHPQFTYLVPELGLTGLQINKSEYDQFYEKYLFNRPYYGDPEGKDSTRYGTYSRHWYYLRPDFYQRKKQKNNFEKKFSNSSDSFNRGGGGNGK